MCRPFNVIAALTTALAPHWTVDRERDPSGELAVIVLPVTDTPARPTFVLYEDNGLVQVLTFLGEDWQKRQTFLTCPRAVSAIIATAARPIRTSGTARIVPAVRQFCAAAAPTAKPAFG
jgi:hypothetical protein